MTVFNSTKYHKDSKDVQRVTKVMMKIWVPEPRKTDSSIPFLGGRKTSPWTSFHPNSSWASSWRERWTHEHEVIIAVGRVLIRAWGLAISPETDTHHRVHLIVAGNVFMQSPQHDHGYHSRQEQHNHQRVHYAGDTKYLFVTYVADYFSLVTCYTGCYQKQGSYGFNWSMVMITPP